MIPAGGSGKITAKIKVNAGSTGSHAKTITVQTDAPATPVLKLTLGYTAVTPITASPSFRLYVNGVEGEPASARVLLHRDDGKPLEARVLDVSYTDGVKIGLEAVDETPTPGDGTAGVAGDLWIVAETSDGSQTVNHNGVVVLATNHPEVPKLEMPLYLRIRPLVEVRPDRVQLWPPEGGPGGSSTNLRLSHSSRKPFEITGIEISHPDLLTARVSSQAGQPIQAVVVSLAEGFKPTTGPVRATVRVTTSVKGRELIEVPVLITDRNDALRRVPLTGSTGAVTGAPAASGEN